MSSSTLAHASSSASQSGGADDLASSPHAASGLLKSRLLELVAATRHVPRDRLWLTGDRGVVGHEVSLCADCRSATVLVEADESSSVTAKRL